MPTKRRPRAGAGMPATLKAKLGVIALSVVFFLFAWNSFAVMYDDPSATEEAGVKTHKKKSVEYANGSSSEEDIVTASGETRWEHYRHTAKSALDYVGLSDSYTNVVLAMIQVESGGDPSIDSQDDVMQAHEGDGKKIIYQGISKEGVRAGTVDASIYAGCTELKLCVKDYKMAYGHKPDPTDHNDVALLAQGYNYGHYGWFRCCKNNGIYTWTKDASAAYQSTIGGIGTANHGGKVSKALEDFEDKYGVGA